MLNLTYVRFDVTSTEIIVGCADTDTCKNNSLVVVKRHV